ncbi:MAG TPA: hypothetical protein VI702_04160, partial [Nitrospiria bacterium]
MDAERKSAIEGLCPELDERTREDFFSQMDPDYFGQYPPEKIAGHLRMSARLGRGHPVEVEIAPLGGPAFEIVVVARDYFSEFSILCGLISAFGLDIQSGNIYTF